MSKLGIFESYARGEADDGSDLDFYMERWKMRSLVEYTAFVMKLEEEFGCHMDVVSLGINDKEFLKRILNEGFLESINIFAFI